MSGDKGPKVSGDKGPNVCQGIRDLWFGMGQGIQSVSVDKGPIIWFVSS